VYNLSERQNINGVPELTEERVKSGLQGYVDKMAAFAQQTPAKKSKKKSNDMLRKALASCVSEFPPPLLDHVLQVVNIDAQVQPRDVIEKKDVLERVMEALHQAHGIVERCMDKPVGYIIAKRKVEGENELGEPLKREDLLYDDYYPFKPKQFLDDSSVHIVDFDSFNKAVDDFYSSIEGQKLESKLQEKEDQARKKLEHAKQDQERRIGSLQQVQELNVRKAQAIEANLARVEEATAAINGLIAQGMDWVEIDRLIELEQKRQNPVAEMIKLPLKLNENTATLLLAEWEEDDDAEGDDLTDEEASDSEAEAPSAKKVVKQDSTKTEDKRLTVDVDLALSGYSNAREYYEQRRNAAAKQEKTVQASEKALKSQTQKIETDLKKALKQEKTVLRAVRKPFWFEKFIYFISSDGYLVLGGKDLQQNDILYKKYLKKGDIFVHADLNGAAPVIIKNNPATPNAEIPPSTLSQAGNLSIATSSAWESKAVMSAWWVPAEQVSKTAPSGDYMQPGTFHIKGKKQFLPPAQLLLGFAIMFQISEESKSRHLKHRVQDPAAVKENTTEDDKEESQSAARVPQDSAGQASENEEAHEDIPEETDDEEDEEEEEEEEHPNSEDRERKYTNPLGDHTAPSTAAKQPRTEDEYSDNEDEDEHETADKAESNNSASSRIHPTSSDTTANQPSAEATDDESASNPATGTNTSSSSAKPKPTNAPLTRGKRAKAKRLAQKYANQDDEDRQLAMQLLGSAAGSNKAAAEAAAREQKEQEAQAAKARRKEIAEKAQKAGLEREMKRLMEQENGEEEEDEGESAAVDMDALVGTLLAGDEVVAAIPICAPWTALGRYKYRAKLQPGSTKKGKAVREILGRWNKDAENKKNVDEKGEDQERIWPKEVECLKELKEREEAAFGVVPVRGVRVMMGGKAGTSSGGSGGSKAKGGRGGRGKKR